MGTTTFIHALAVLVAALGAAPSSARAEPSRTVSFDSLGPVRVGGDAPWFAAEDARRPERPLNLKRLLAPEGSEPPTQLVLVFFATWCEPCREGLERLRAGAAELERARVRVVLVDYQETPAEVSEFLTKMGLGALPAAVDKFGVNAQSYGVATGQGGTVTVSLPKTFVIGRDSKVRAILGLEGEDYVARLMPAAPAPPRLAR